LLGGETRYEMRLHSTMMLSGGSYDRRCSMPVSVQQSYPIAHLPLVLGVLRRLGVATVIDGLIPPHPAHGLSCGRGVEAMVLAILDGHHALYKGEDGGHGHEKTSKRFASLQAMGSEMERRWLASRPMFTRYKV